MDMVKYVQLNFKTSLTPAKHDEFRIFFSTNIDELHWEAMIRNVDICLDVVQNHDKLNI